MLGFVEKTGDFIITFLQSIGKIIILLFDVLRSLKRSRPPFREIIKQGYFIGSREHPRDSHHRSLRRDGTLAYEAYGQLSRLGVTSWIGPLVTNSLVLQLGPVLSGVMLAGRVGSAMTAELGTMAVTEQIDALRTMGVNPISYLVAPRVLMATILTPVLTAFAIVIGVFAGYSSCVSTVSE